MEQKPTYTLDEIATWAESKEVSLPTVQRGFVWKPSQIENLWDSLLRGYPVGAFVMSPKKDEGFEMLDGQQRATAICLGFGRDTFRDSQDKIKVFIDLGDTPVDDNRKFIFRVITKSHPWGYSRTDNTKTLSSDNIRKAMSLYDVDDYLQADLDKFFPYDASLPVPLSIFVHCAIKEYPVLQLIKEIQVWNNWSLIKHNWDEKIEKIQFVNRENPRNPKELPELLNDDKITRRIQEIYESIKGMLDPEFGQKIPALYLDFEKFRQNVNAKFQSEIESEVDEEIDEINDLSEEFDNKIDEIENLFVRLNAGGTPLRGEELNYSILKAHISPELQKKIEETCQSIFKPARFITIIYRLFQQNKKEVQKDALAMRIKPKQFQKSVSDKTVLAEFEKFLQKIIKDHIYEGKTLLEYARHYIEYDENSNVYGLPYLITAKISDVAPEIMFMYLYRIKQKGDRFGFNTELHRRAIGMITLFMWLGRGEKQRDHSKLLSNIWPCVQSLTIELFWTSSTVQRANIEKVLTPFPSFDRKHDRKSLIQLKKFTPKSNSDVFFNFERQTGYGEFIWKMFFNRDLILYAQRPFLSKFFNESQYHLDDTNMPFDWDHISPHKLIHNKKGIPLTIRQWYNTIGNLRAWPYSLNRMDQDESPARKLNPLGQNENDTELELITSKWESYIKKNKLIIQSIDELNDKLLYWSFCSPNWETCEVSDIKKDWKRVYPLIIERNLSLAKEWFKELRIEDLKPSKTEIFSTLLDNRKWDKNSKKDGMRNEFSYEDVDYWISKPIIVKSCEIQIYFTYSAYLDKILDENGIVFGILEKETKGIISTIKFPEKLKDDFDTDKKSYVQGYFTLISHEEESYFQLLKEFSEWLRKFPNSSDIRKLNENFIELLVTKFKSKLRS